MRQERSFSCQPLSRHQHCALALPVQKQFGVTLTEVECVEQRRSKSHIQGFPCQAFSKSCIRFSPPRLRRKTNNVEHA